MRKKLKVSIEGKMAGVGGAVRRDNIIEEKAVEIYSHLSQKDFLPWH
jgi:hypothetical protein